MQKTLKQTNLSRIHWVLLLCLTMCSSMVSAQSVSISGTIVDQNKVPIIGATVIVQGTTRGTATDLDGNYTISANQGETLIYTSIGYMTINQVVGAESVINVTMYEDNVALDEFVVIGYGTSKKSDLTGSVVSVNAEDLARFPASNVSEMLRGQAAGVQVTLGSAAPGGSSEILIRGNRSLSSSQSPLYLVDGMVVPHLNDVNSSDIASIEVLKDASSQAIYGARASNGVVLITTKKGSEGRLKVDLSSYVSVQQLNRNFDMYSPEEWTQLRYWAKANEGTVGIGTPDNINYEALLGDDVYFDSWTNQEFTDWEDIMTTNAIQHKHDLSISGGNEKISAAFGIGYFNQEGLIIGSDYERINARASIDWDPFKWLNISIKSSLSTSTKHNADANFSKIVTMPSLSKAYDSEGNVLRESSSTGGVSPLWNNQEYKHEQLDDNYINNLGLTFKIIEGLTYRFSLNLRNAYRDFGEYKTTKYPGSTGDGKITDYKRQSYLFDNVLNYNIPIRNEDHALSLTLIQSAEQDLQTTTGYNFINSPSDLFDWNMAASAEVTDPIHSVVRTRLSSFAARAQYSLMDRYLFTASVRRDGSSVLGAYNKWGTFPSAAVAWKINEENFLKQTKWLDLLKLRVSYGVVGNSSIPAYRTQGEAISSEYLFGSGFGIGYLPSDVMVNPDLKWETTQSTNFGLDFTAFKGRLNATAEAYITNSSDLLINRSISSITGYSSMWDNLGKTKSHGYELAVTGHIISNRDFNWNVSVTYSRHKNQIVEIDGRVNSDGEFINDPANNWYIGQSINANLDYVFGGIWQTGETPTQNDYLPGSAMPVPGDVKLLDYNGDGKITSDDQKIYNLDPQGYGTISTSLSYKGIDMYLEFYGVHDIWKNNTYLYSYNQGGSLQGVLNGMKVDYWTPDNPSNTAPRPQFTASVPNFDVVGWQDASYFRLRTATLGYTFPEELTKKIAIQKARLYFTATNLFTATKFKSYSPEKLASAYPEPQTFLFGLNLSF